jgi:hypothetical protein
MKVAERATRCERLAHGLDCLLLGVGAYERAVVSGVAFEIRFAPLPVEILAVECGIN